MTRFTKIARKKHLNATPWSEYKKQQHGESDQGKNELTVCMGEEQDSKLSEESTESQSIENEVQTKSKRKKKKKQNNGETVNTSASEKEDKQLSAGHTWRKEKVEKLKLARKLRRQKMKKCFSCRERGHSVKDCPLISTTESNVCYHCASSEHTTKYCPRVASSKETRSGGQFSFASCFICKEKGHIARSCPQNPRGLYPDGGGCKMCGSVEHFKKDCPELQTRTKDKPGVGTVVTGWKRTSSHFSTDSLDDVEEKSETYTVKKKKKKIVKF